MWYDRYESEELYERIIYQDPRNGTFWVAQGFCKGEYVG